MACPSPIIPRHNYINSRHKTSVHGIAVQIIKKSSSRKKPQLKSFTFNWPSYFTWDMVELVRKSELILQMRVDAKQINTIPFIYTKNSDRNAKRGDGETLRFWKERGAQKELETENDKIRKKELIATKELLWLGTSELYSALFLFLQKWEEWK